MLTNHLLLLPSSYSHFSHKSSLPYNILKSKFRAELYTCRIVSHSNVSRAYVNVIIRVSECSRTSPCRSQFRSTQTNSQNLCFRYQLLRGGVKKKNLYFWVVGTIGGGGGSRPDHNFRPKNYKFFFAFIRFKTLQNV